MHAVYALYNSEHNKYYIGQTEDLDERLRAHQDHRFGRSYTTRFSGVWSLIYKEEYTTREEALKREKQLKSYQGRQFVKQFIPG